MPLLRRLLRLPALLPPLVPCTCALCGSESGGMLCNGCERAYFNAQRRRCICCALPLPNDGSPAQRCGACLREQPAYDAALTAVDYVAPLEQLVLGLKFGRRVALAPLMAAKLAEACGSARLAMPSLLTAVPLGPQRLVERGFNQAAEIARPLAGLLQLPLDLQLLQRRRDTAPQALLRPEARRRNLRRAFTVRPERMRQLRGAHVGVVDDVMTTGATLNEAAATLKRCGAARVTVLVFARTLD